MTSDAKIGLLLGLVFIFIIAFVINGLPRFRNTTNGSELTTNMVSSQNDPLGIGEKEREVQDLIDWPQPQTEDQQLETETVQPPIEDEENVRFKIKLPENISYPQITETAQESTPDKPLKRSNLLRPNRLNHSLLNCLKPPLHNRPPRKK